MQISSVNRVSLPINVPGKEEAQKSSPFSDFLTDAIENTTATDAEDNRQTVGLITGESNDLHSAMIAMEKADLALQFTVQIRNKIIEAYNEIMRMQI